MNFETLKARALGLDGRLVEDELYRIVWEEIERGEMDKAAKARATAEAGSDEGQLRGHTSAIALGASRMSWNSMPAKTK